MRDAFGGFLGFDPTLPDPVWTVVDLDRAAYGHACPPSDPHRPPIGPLGPFVLEGAGTRRVRIRADDDASVVYATHSAPLLSSDLGVSDVALSSDGRRLAYSVTPALGSFVSNARAFVIDADDADRGATPLASPVYALRWAPDGSAVYAAVADEEDMALYRWRIAPTGGDTATPASTTSPCDAAETDQWVRDLRDRTLRYNELARHATERHGAPISCAGEVTTEFDGALYGRVTLEFAGGVALSVETQPIETSIVTLTSGVGFADEVQMRALVAAYTEGAGFRIDWSAPEHGRDGELRRERFWDPEPGANASATLTFRGDELIEVRVSWAL